MPSTPRTFRLLGHSASAEEAAAVVAALERFIRATAPAHGPAGRAGDPWQRTALLEGVERDRQEDLADPWINT